MSIENRLEPSPIGKEQTLNCEPYPLIDAKRAAVLLGTSRKHLYDLAARDLVPSLRVGRRLRFSPKALAEFIARGGSRASVKTPSDLTQGAERVQRSHRAGGR
jgi:excisionase family DNA binding protein